MVLDIESLQQEIDNKHTIGEVRGLKNRKEPEEQAKMMIKKQTEIPSRVLEDMNKRGTKQDK